MNSRAITVIATDAMMHQPTCDLVSANSCRTTTINGAIPNQAKKHRKNANHDIWLGVAAGAAGLVALGCSMMIYIDTQRAFWSPSFTVTKFLGTSMVLGIPVVLLISLAVAAVAGSLMIDDVLATYGRRLCQTLAVIATLKLLFEATIFAALRNKRHTSLKRTALLLTGELSMKTAARFFFGVMGGVLLPLVLLGEPRLAPESGFHPIFVGVVALLVLGLCLVGEFLERYLYFTAVVAPKMPGT